MTTFPGSPRLVKGGIALLDPTTGIVRRIIALQYNPDSMSRTLQAQAVGAGGDRSEALRLKGPPIETIKVDAEIDAADQLEHPDQFPDVGRLGIHPQLAALEAILYPASRDLLANNDRAGAGVLEIAPVESALCVFVWSSQRIVPVRLTDFSVTEEAFDPALNPLRAKVSLGMRVLSVSDLGFAHKGGGMYITYQRQLEALAARAPQASLSTLGVARIG